MIWLDFEGQKVKITASHRGGEGTQDITIGFLTLTAFR